MNCQDWIEAAAFARFKEDDDLYLEWTGYLPEGGDGHTAAHSVRCFRYAFQIATPFTILEIGFNRGHSATMMLEMGAMHVTSVDINRAPGTLEAVRLVKRRYIDRFEFISSDSKTVEIDGRFDMIFIDGDHSFDGVISDIRLGQKLGIKWFLFDDWQPRFAATQEAIAVARLIPLAIFGNMALAIPNDGLIGVLG